MIPVHGLKILQGEAAVSPGGGLGWKSEKPSANISIMAPAGTGATPKTFPNGPP